MDYKHTSLESRKFAEQDSVEDDGQQHRADRKQHAMPCGYSVSRIVQSNHTLYCKSCTVTSTDQSSLPAQDLGFG